jgi:ribosome recycling factor
MSDFIGNFKPTFNKLVEHFGKELNALRIGRATPSLVENVSVLAYGAPTPLIHLASIAATDPKTITIQPWDKNLIKDIEKALQQTDLGSSPIVQEGLIIVNIPPLTEELRKEIVKKVHQKAEETKVAIRGAREKVKEQIIAMEEEKQMSEDDKFKRLEELDVLVKDYNEQVKEIVEKKEDEIMKV